jgi:hypothetical protein
MLLGVLSLNFNSYMQNFHIFSYLILEFILKGVFVGASFLSFIEIIDVLVEISLILFKNKINNEQEIS